MERGLQPPERERNLAAYWPGLLSLPSYTSIYNRIVKSLLWEVPGNTRLTLVTSVLPSVVIEVREYIDTNGRNRYRNWIAGLDSGTRARVLATVLRMESGNISGASSAGAGVLELRLDFGPGFRVYFGRDGETIVVLLCGGTKRRQQADIDEAQGLWAEYKRRKREG